VLGVVEEGVELCEGSTGSKKVSLEREPPTSMPKYHLREKYCEGCRRSEGRGMVLAIGLVWAEDVEEDCSLVWKGMKH